MSFYLINEKGEKLCKEVNCITNDTLYKFLSDQRVQSINTYHNHDAKPIIFFSKQQARRFIVNYHLENQIKLEPDVHLVSRHLGLAY